MRELLYDDYRIFGCGLESLVSFAREFDQTSRTVLLDFSEATIYSMLPGKDDLQPFSIRAVSYGLSEKAGEKAVRHFL